MLRRRTGGRSLVRSVVHLHGGHVETRLKSHQNWPSELLTPPKNGQVAAVFVKEGARTHYDTRKNRRDRWEASTGRRGEALQSVVRRAARAAARDAGAGAPILAASAGRRSAGRPGRACRRTRRRGSAPAARLSRRGEATASAGRRVVHRREDAAVERHALTSSASARMTAQRAGTACGCWKRRHEGRDSSGWPARGHEA